MNGATVAEFDDEGFFIMKDGNSEMHEFLAGVLHDMRGTLSALQALSSSIDKMQPSEAALLKTGLKRLKHISERISIRLGDGPDGASQPGDSGRASASSSSEALKTSAPPTLDLKKGDFVWVIDDDPTIHELWKRKLARFNFFVAHHLSLESATHAWNERKAKYPNAALPRFLVDYEFRGNAESGLDWIKRHDLVARSSLITTRAGQSKIQAMAQALGVKIYAKSDLPRLELIVEAWNPGVPSSSAEAQRPPMHVMTVASLESRWDPTPVRQEIRDAASCADLILVDDDDLIRQLWTEEAKRNSVEICLLSSPEEAMSVLLSTSSPVPRDKPIFVDAHLEGSQEVGKELFETQHIPSGLHLIYGLKKAGFTNLVIVSGSPRDHLEPVLIRTGLTEIRVAEKEFPKKTVARKP